MHDPQKTILQAFHTALGGLALPVYTTIPLGKDEYVLISQPTLAPGSGSLGCMSWEATLLLSVYTRFEQRNTVSLAPALDVSNELVGRLLGQRLALDGFSMSPAEVQRVGLTQRSDELAVYVQDNLRVRFTVYS